MCGWVGGVFGRPGMEEGRCEKGAEGRVSWKLWGANKGRFFDSRLDDINKNCLEAFRKHWECLDQNNQQLWQCRRREMKLNGCVFDKLVSLSLLPPPPPLPNFRARQRILIEICLWWQKLEKTIPGTPENETPVHLRKRQIYAQNL